MLEGDVDIPQLPDRPVPLVHDETFQSSLLHGLQRIRLIVGVLVTFVLYEFLLLCHMKN